MENSDSKTLEVVFAKLGEARHRAVTARDQARASALEAIDDMLDNLEKALNGEVLKCFPNISPTDTPFYGVRLRSLIANDQKYKLPEDGSSVLCIDARGEIVQASIIPDENGNPSVWVEVASEEALFAEDLSHLTGKLAHYLDIQVSKYETDAAKFTQLKDAAFAAMLIL